MTLTLLLRRTKADIIKKFSLVNAAGGSCLFSLYTVYQALMIHTPVLGTHIAQDRINKKSIFDTGTIKFLYQEKVKSKQYISHALEATTS